MTKHTPGPWEVERASLHYPSGEAMVTRSENVTLREAIAILGPDGRAVAYVDAKPTIPLLRAESADAREAREERAIRTADLIASAPELLAALEQMLAAFPAPAIRAPGGFDGNLAHAAARAALAKARP